MDGISEALFLGALQGITEWLPISSSAHLALAQHFLGLKANLYFDLVLHLGTILSVFAYYRNELAALAMGALRLDTKQLKYLALVLLAAVPTALIGFGFQDFFESMFSAPHYIAVALLLTGFFLLIVSRAEGKAEPDAKSSLLVGLAQGIAVAPGISRSGATMGTALLLGIKKEEAAKFSFLAGIIPITGAALLEGRHALSTTPDLLPLAIGFLTSFAVGYLSIGLLLRVLRERGLAPFGYYCIILSALVSILLWFGL